MKDEILIDGKYYKPCNFKRRTSLKEKYVCLMKSGNEWYFKCDGEENCILYDKHVKNEKTKKKTVGGGFPW
jgi:hypothetical protein